MDSTRIDKYLWAIRVYKTRSEATEACKGGKVRLNGVDVKPSRELKRGDLVSVRKGAVQYSYKVLDVLEKRVGAALVAQYAEDLTPEEELSKLHAPMETIVLRRDRGAGRPTKKDRRQLDSLMDCLQE